MRVYVALAATLFAFGVVRGALRERRYRQTAEAGRVLVDRLRANHSRRWIR